MTGVAVGALLVVLASDRPISSGTLTIHPTSGNSLVKGDDGAPRFDPDPKVELDLRSYELPTRPHNGPASLAAVRCAVTLTVKGGETSAAVDQRPGETPCAMGSSTEPVVEVLSRWKFDTVSEENPDPYWVNLSVYFEEGSTTAQVD